MKKILILGGGGFIGGHLAKRLFNEGNFVRVVDIKEHEYFNQNEFCSEFVKGDLRDPKLVSLVMLSPKQNSLDDKDNSFDEVYQLAADMGGAGYIFTGENDANVMHNSALINLNVSYYASKFNVKKVFYSSSACMYPEHNQLDPDNPNCEESSAYPANPDSEYGWEKLFSERLYFAFMRNYNLDVRVARFHNIFGPYGTWDGGKEKAPAAMCRKVAESYNEIEVWGDGKQTRSFLYIDDCVNAILKMMEGDFVGPVNIGSEEMVTINELAQMAIDISNKEIKIKNIGGNEFFNKYGFKCPVGVKGRNSDNRLFIEKIGNPNYRSLYEGMKITYDWINKQVEKGMTRKKPVPQNEESESKPFSKKDYINSVIKKKQKDKFLSPHQEEYYNILKENEITICSGPAGVGKSYIAMKAAVDLLMDPNNSYEKLIIVRPAVEAEEKLGSLPGNLEEKLDPYIFPSYYLLNKIIGKDAREKLKDAEIIEVFALAYMRGMNIDNSILIFEEAQNSTPNQMKLLLTRIGFNSKFFISGDLEQTDRYKDKKQSGLYDALQRFKNINDIGVYDFRNAKNVRNPLISKILEKYDEENRD